MKKKISETQKNKTGSQNPSNMRKREKTEAKLLREKQLFQILAEQSSDLIVFLNQEMIVTYGNPAVERALGLKSEEVIGSHIFEHLHPDDVKLVTKIFNTMIRDTNSKFQRVEVRLRHKNGSWNTFEAVGSNLVHNNVVEAVIVNLYDITKRKKAEETLRDSEQKFRETLLNLDEGYFSTTLNGKLLEHNQALNRILGFDINENLTGFNIPDLWQNKEDRQDYLRAFAATDSISKYQINAKTQKGEKIILLASAHLVRNEDNIPLRIEGIFLDITERKKVEEKLLYEEQRFRALIEHSLDIIAIMNLKGVITYINPAIERVLGFKVEERIGASGFERIHPDELKLVTEALNTLVNDTSSPVLKTEVRLRHKDGSWRTFEAVGSNLVHNNVVEAVIVNYRDITERKNAEEKLRENERQYRILTEKMSDIIWIADMNLRTIYISPSVKNILGFSQEERMHQTLDEQLTPNSLSLVLDVLSKELTLEKLGNADPNRTLTIELEYYHKDGSTRWMELVISGLRNDQGVLTRIHGVSRDINERNIAEDKLQQTLESLRKAIGTTIQVLVSAVEMRDPYTSGHQIRSADLARAIATEMGLPQDKVDGIRMAGIIHDIGKLSIPAEILSKPTKLTEIEFSLIKEHSQSGYEMLTDVESPWPLAEIVYQHHERMNGSGYPRNLKGDEILMESRILAVADVMEAMASHRPYRPSFGIEAALKEISKNKGILYDNTVVDACLRLFREKGYQLK